MQSFNVSFIISLVESGEYYSLSLLSVWSSALPFDAFLDYASIRLGLVALEFSPIDWGFLWF
jgi:Mn2+/Fe2+ NRAMP family transporter